MAQQESEMNTMVQKMDGQNYAPEGAAVRVCGPGEFPVGVIGLDHGHIFGMCNGLSEAGADIALVWDLDPAKIEDFCKRYPQAKAARCEAEVLEDPRIKLIASAGIPDVRGTVGVAALEHGKDYFVDKPPMTTRAQVQSARDAVRRTGGKFGVYYSERLHVESAEKANELVKQGAIGRVVQVMGWGPHRISAPTRPGWFFDRARYGGILVDIGSHQIEQILTYAGTSDGQVVSSRIANYNHKEYPLYEDFGDATLTLDNGAVGYFRVDWFTPNGLRSWGDGRTVILGTDGYIELRKYLNVGEEKEGNHLFLVNHEGEQHLRVTGTYGYPFFGRFIRDCLDRTETAMGQAHAFRAIELAIEAQERAVQVE